MFQSKAMLSTQVKVILTTLYQLTNKQHQKAQGLQCNILHTSLDNVKKGAALKSFWQIKVTKHMTVVITKKLQKYISWATRFDIVIILNCYKSCRLIVNPNLQFQINICYITSTYSFCRLLQYSVTCWSFTLYKSSLGCEFQNMQGYHILTLCKSIKFIAKTLVSLKLSYKNESIHFKLR